MNLQTYAAIYLCESDEDAVRDFLIKSGIPKAAVRRRLHITIYHGNVVFSDLVSTDRPVDIKVDVSQTKFLVLVDGGEIPSPGINPSQKKVGIRLKQVNAAIPAIQALRSEFTSLETPELLGDRQPSTDTRHAFSPYERYRPHVTLLHRNNQLERDFTPLAHEFRARHEHLVFDRLKIRVEPQR